MKKLLGIMMVLSVMPSFAAVDVISASYNRSTGKIEAQLQYGGCKIPSFRIEFDHRCYESLPPQADGEVIQTAGDDGCERLNHKTVSFSLRGDSCVSYGRHLVNLKGKGSRRDTVRVAVD